MLQQLTVNNFAIIDNITIEFKNHLSVLTGATGAGKSLIIDAIGLLLGDRASNQMIRTGEEKATIEGIFTSYNETIDNLLDQFGIDKMDYLIIRRDIYKNGKSISRINGYVVTLSQLTTISNLLADIHTQLDTKKLFDLRNYVDFIDNEEIRKEISKYQEIRNEYLEHLKAYNHLVDEFKKGQDNFDFYQFRLNELKSMNLSVDEVANLEEELNVLNNYETINSNLSEIKETFRSQDILNSLYSIKQQLVKLASFNEKYAELAETVDGSYYDLEDVEQTISSNLAHLEFDNKRFDYINERISAIKDIERKYRMSVEQLIDYQKSLEELVNNFDQSEFLINNELIKVKESFDKLTKKAAEITVLRVAQSKILIDNINKTLVDLCLDKVRIKITVDSIKPNNEFDQSAFKENGNNIVDFLISFNIGEELRPLSKVASGGEMSRIMLALKTHMLQNMNLSTIIFDEIDTGISGEVAMAVAKKMKEISKTTQVLAITHLPIVASAADQHLFVSKEVKDNKTYTIVKLLSKEERIEKVAEMISSSNNDISSLLVAENMINNFKEK